MNHNSGTISEIHVVVDHNKECNGPLDVILQISGGVKRLPKSLLYQASWIYDLTGNFLVKQRGDVQPHLFAENVGDVVDSRKWLIRHGYLVDPNWSVGIDNSDADPLFISAHSRTSHGHF